ncbi:MAG: amino acid adenylation domain-containing protein [Mycolicibacterium cosmeticum]|nr:amino acid adenylation domain-containing protein [Mycolicibacterium cosmeticum]
MTFIATRDGRGTTIQDLFAEQAAHTPDAPAIVHRAGTLSYAELDACANALAARLIQMGLPAGAGVAFLCDWTPLLPIALLGILKAGGHYIPLDPDYPATRMNHILADAEPFALLTDRDAGAIATHGIQTAAPLVHLTASDAAVTSHPGAPYVGSADDLVYSIYTSGSTGKPKGTLNFQRGVVNLNRWMADEVGVGPGTRFMVLTSIGFDLTSKGVCAPLISGGAVVVYQSPVYDPADIRRAIVDLGVNAFAHTPTGLYGLIEDGRYDQLTGIERLVISGEALRLDRIRDWLTHPDYHARFISGYGPTECSDLVAAHDVTAADLAAGGVCPLGGPLPGIVLTVRDAELNPVAPGTKGELCVQGIGVGGGYRNLPEKTAATFVADPHGGDIVYRSGDLASQGTDGAFLYHGRLDYQVKIRGYRVELAEIEQALNRCPGVLDSVVTAPEHQDGERFPAAYLRTEDGHPLDRTQLNSLLAAELPDYMLPAAYTFMAEFPVNASFKVDRGALPAPAFGRPALAVAYRAPGDDTERTVAGIWDQLVGFTGSGVDDPFFEVGGNSLTATRLVARLNAETGAALTIVQFFETPTIAGVAAALRPAQRDVVRAIVRSTPRTSDHIAIVGMAARVPGAADVGAFWRNLLDGVDSLRLLSAEELEAAGVTPGPDHVPVSGWVEDSDAFDHQYFGYTPYEAERIDPQQRLLLEIAAGAFEDAGIATGGQERSDRGIDPGGQERSDRGIDPGGAALRAGIYASVAANSYATRNVLPHDGLREYGLGHALVGNDKDYAATRIAYKLGLTGPAMTVQTACSSSGAALHLACQALLSDDCDVALAGGASLPWQYQHGHDHLPGGALSADGRIRAFDAAASGMALTGGGACVVLRRLDDALAEGHTIHAVIRATALNNDGRQRASFTAPSIAGQRAVVRTALDRSGVDARSIEVLEAHGTGTPLGDPIEVTAITQAWRQDTADTGYCAIGSVKSNIGHLDAAAATVGAIKLALMLREGERPATLHVEDPNPDCAFETSPFYVNDRRTSWAGDGPRRGALSSFGFGGTNFHAILEQGPQPVSTPGRRGWQVLRLSAKTEAALRQQIADLTRTLATTPEALPDIAYTLDAGRNRHPYRAAVVAGSVAQARDRLTAPEQVLTGSDPAPRPHLVFTFPGQGAQHVGMGRRLYETESVFRSAVNECADILLPALGVDLRDIIFTDDEQAAEALRATQLAQPAIFTISYATARLWLSWGLAPETMLGHSVGEFVAATLAGVFELEHALLILAERARLMQSMPAGGMLAVRLSETEAAQYVGGDIAIAGVNSPQLTVLSGPRGDLEALSVRLDADGVATTVLHTSHAFHSPMMDPIVGDFARVVGQYPRSAPRLPFYSSLTGLPITDAQAQDPHYWAQQLRNAVRFAPALQHLAQTPGCVLLECGPGQNLTTSTRQTFGAQKMATAIASLPHAGASAADDAEHLGLAVGRLFVAGVDTDPRRVHAGETRRLVSLPTYPFARTRHWLTPTAALPAAAAPAPTAATAEVLAENEIEADTGPLGAIRALFADVAGVDIGPDDDHRSFLELGFDSLLLTQVTTQLNQRMKVSLRFRQLLEEFPTPASLAEHLQTLGDPDAPAAKVFGAGAKITKAAGEELTARQRAALDDFVARYIARTAKSRAYADEHRPHLADPRAVSGFRPLWKDMVYPLVSAESKGPRFTDIDGNTYVDITNGFGSIFFGHRPDFMVQAVHEQIDSDIIIGPQNPRAGETARLFAEMTGHERVAFCNTGSEAVLAAIRLARTITGRNLIVQHEGDYHGITDEVLVRGTASGRTIPAAPGIPPESVANTLVLEYGTAASLETLRARAHELAAVVIEPVQSRKPDLQPADYVREVRRICDESGTALIMDEVVCGFRVHWSGAQGMWGVKADIACYGKVFGAGMPVGAIAGTPRFLDALDGGSWQFGDDSMPEVGVTYFAGTFVRHPLTMAVVDATLRHMKDNPHLQDQVSAVAEDLVHRLNTLFKTEGVPMHIGRFGSLMKPEWTQDLAFGELLYFFLREAGVNAWDGRPNYLTTTHGPAEIDFIVDGFAYAIAQMKQGGFLDDVKPSAELFGIPAHSDEPITVPSTESQREVWLAAKFVGNNTVAYNEGLGLTLDGELDQQALRRSLQILLDRHESLRAHFSRDGRSLIIEPHLALDLPVHDVTHLDEAARAKALEQCCDEEMAETFDLRRGPLVRFRLVRLSPTQHRLLFTAHHAVCDGWSGAVVLTELAALYSADVERREISLPAAPRYADYTLIERHFLQSSEGQAHQHYWLEQLRDSPAPPQLPPDRVAESGDLRAARVDVPLDAELVSRLRSVGSTHGASLVATMLTAFAGLFYRHTGQDDMVIGLAAAGQSFHDQGKLVGHCVNLLPLRLRQSGTESFAAALGTTRGAILDAYDHQGVSFGTLLPELQLTRQDDRPPLVSVVFNIDVRDDDIHHTGLTVGYDTLVRQAETFELFINIVDNGSALVLEASYRTGLYSEDQIRGYLASYEALLRSACEAPEGSLDQLTI